MTDEILLRALAAVPVALLLPLGLPFEPRWRLRGPIAFGITAAALAGEATHWQTWVIVAAATAASAISVADRHRPWRLLLAMAAVLAVAIGATGPGPVLDRMGALADDADVVVVVAGGLTTVFLGGAVIGMLLHPFAALIRPEDAEETKRLEHAGRVIGWIERALLYGLVLVGAPGAAALVIAGKSVARFPSFREERFAEYYLIGSLMSLAIALGLGLAVRAIVGLDPVAPL